MLTGDQRATGSVSNQRPSDIPAIDQVDAGTVAIADLDMKGVLADIDGFLNVLHPFEMLYFLFRDGPIPNGDSTGSPSIQAWQRQPLNDFSNGSKTDDQDFVLKNQLLVDRFISQGDASVNAIPYVRALIEGDEMDHLLNLRYYRAKMETAFRQISSLPFEETRHDSFKVMLGLMERIRQKPILIQSVRDKLSCKLTGELTVLPPLPRLADQAGLIIQAQLELYLDVCLRELWTKPKEGWEASVLRMLGSLRTYASRFSIAKHPYRHPERPELRLTQEQMDIGLVSYNIRIPPWKLVDMKVLKLVSDLCTEKSRLGNDIVVIMKRITHLIWGTEIPFPWWPLWIKLAARGLTIEFVLTQYLRKSSIC